MKKILLGLLVGVGAAVPTSVLAWGEPTGPPHPKPIYSICQDTNGEQGCNTWVSVFDDSGNKCYVVTIYNNTQPAISCLKQ